MELELPFRFRGPASFVTPLREDPPSPSGHRADSEGTSTLKLPIMEPTWPRARAWGVTGIGLGEARVLESEMAGRAALPGRL